MIKQRVVAIRGWTVPVALVFALSGGLGCHQENASPPPRRRDGTARMADTLAFINAQALAHPELNPFLNRERADAIQAVSVLQIGAESWNSRHQLAEERLKGGETVEAITALEALMRDAGLSLNGGVSADTITPKKKPVFDLLAIAYLRLGEQENCLGNPASNVCILPLKDGGMHTHQEGARGAIARFTELLRHFPDDRGSQWLLNIAYMAIGAYPDSVPKRYLIPNLTPDPKDKFPRYPNIAGEVGLAVTGLAGGLDIADFNGDGLLDVFTTSSGITEPVHLFLADGKGGYVDRSAKSGLMGIVGGLNTTHADYDNDGDEDILIMRGGWLGEAGKYPMSLLRNRGDGTFDDVTFASGLVSFQPTHTAAWADFNLDGYLDLFVGHESSSKVWGGPSHPSELFLNNRDGTFTEVSKRVGIDLDDFVKGATWGDVNNDGLPDLYVSVLYGRNRLYINRGGNSIDNWRFEETSASAGVELPIASFATWFWDFDQDGWEDLLVLSYDVSPAVPAMVAREYLGLPPETVENGKTVKVEATRLYRNNHDGSFSDVTRQVGLENKVIYAMGSNFGDLDNDGWLDFYLGTGNPAFQSIIPNRMFHNVRGRRFEEVTLPGGFGHIQKGHGTAFADLDRDGDEDVFMVLGGAYEGDRFSSVLFENPGWPDNKWITLELEGRSANRSAIGARVEVVVADATGATRTIRRTVSTGGSFGAGSLQLHVGLGRAARVQKLRILWPDSARTKTSYTGLDVNHFYHIVEGEQPVELDRPAVPFRKTMLSAMAAEHHPPDSPLIDAGVVRPNASPRSSAPYPAP